jgi:glutamate dehydrogenase (NAD(P)+)
VEYHGGTQASAFATIDERIRANTRQVLENARKSGQRPREAALDLAHRRVRQAMSYRRA